MAFATLRFLEDHFTDVDGVMASFKSHGFPCPQREAVRKWFSRESVPWEWGALLIAIAQIETPLDMRAYLGNESYDIFN